MLCRTPKLVPELRTLPVYLQRVCHALYVRWNLQMKTRNERSGGRAAPDWLTMPAQHLAQASPGEHGVKESGTTSPVSNTTSPKSNTFISVRESTSHVSKAHVPVKESDPFASKALRSVKEILRQRNEGHFFR